MMFEWIGKKMDVALKWVFTSWTGGYICGVLVALLINFLVSL